MTLVNGSRICQLRCRRRPARDGEPGASSRCTAAPRAVCGRRRPRPGWSPGLAAVGTRLHRSTPITRLAELEQASAPAITKMVNALESAGLAQRERSEADPRVVRVSATPDGRRLLERGRAARVRAIAALLAEATEAQLQTLRVASEVIAARLTAGPVVTALLQVSTPAV